jgi:four helix bundle protein
MRNDKEKVIVKLTIDFALDIIAYTELLEEQRKYVIARQLLNSGTSIGANVRESLNAESKIAVNSQHHIKNHKLVQKGDLIFKSSNFQI